MIESSQRPPFSLFLQERGLDAPSLWHREAPIPEYTEPRQSGAHSGIWVEIRGFQVDAHSSQIKAMMMLLVLRSSLETCSLFGVRLARG